MSRTPPSKPLHDDRWVRRLLLAVLGSLAIHLAPFTPPVHLPPPPKLDFEVQVSAVEFGVVNPNEGNQPVAPAPAPTPTPPAPPTPRATSLPEVLPPPPTPPPARAHTQPRAPQTERPEPPPPERDPDQQMPPRREPPRPEGPEHAGAEVPVRPNAVDRPPTAETPDRPPTPETPGRHAERPSDRPPRARDERPVADRERTGDREGRDVPDPRALRTAATQIATQAMPAGPSGGYVSITLRPDRLRDDPHAAAVSRLLSTIPDWQAMIGDGNLDVVHDLDALVMVAANPFGVGGRPRDWIVLARAAGHDDVVLRRAVEALQNQRNQPAPSPSHPPDAGPSTFPDASAPSSPTQTPPPPGVTPDAGTPRPARPAWERRADGSARMQIESYGAERSYVTLPNGLAAIALPSQVEPLMTAVTRPVAAPDANAGPDDPTEVLTLEMENAARLVSFPTRNGPFPMPLRLSLALHTVPVPEGTARSANLRPRGRRTSRSAPARTFTGQARLDARFQYPNAEAAQRALGAWTEARAEWLRIVDGYASNTLSAILARTAGVDLTVVRDAVQGLTLRLDGELVRMEGGLTAPQVDALLRAAELLPRLAGNPAPPRR